MNPLAKRCGCIENTEKNEVALCKKHAGQLVAQYKSMLMLGYILKDPTFQSVLTSFDPKHFPVKHQ